MVAPKPDGNGGYFGTIDPALLTAADGKRYIYYGGFYGGISVTELTPDGLHAVGEPTQVTVGDRYEGCVRRLPRRLVLPDGLVDELLRGPDHRVLRVRRPLPVAARARSSTPTA